MEEQKKESVDAEAVRVNKATIVFAVVCLLGIIALAALFMNPTRPEVASKTDLQTTTSPQVEVGGGIGEQVDDEAAEQVGEEVGEIRSDLPSFVRISANMPIGKDELISLGDGSSSEMQACMYDARCVTPCDVPMHGSVRLRAEFGKFVKVEYLGRGKYQKDSPTELFPACPVSTTFVMETKVYALMNDWYKEKFQVQADLQEAVDHFRK